MMLNTEQVIKAPRKKYSDYNTFTSYLTAYAPVLRNITSVQSDCLKITTLAKDQTRQDQPICSLTDDPQNY